VKWLKDAGLDVCTLCTTDWSVYAKAVGANKTAGMAPIAMCITCNGVFVRDSNQQRQCEQCKAEGVADQRWRGRSVRGARERASTDGNSHRSAIRRRQVFERDKWQCQLCGVCVRPHKQAANEPDEATVDHIIPLAKGGLHTMENVQTACRQCNTEKSDAMDWQPEAKQRRVPK